MIDARALAALQEAAMRIEAEVPEPGPEEERAALLETQARLRRPTPEECARGWRSRNREIGRAPSLTIATPGEAVAIWRRGVRRRTGGDRPPDAGSRSPRAGRTAEEQVVAKVRLARELLLPGETLDAAILAWPLPLTFHDDPPPLCGMEEELLADPMPYSPPPEAEEEGRRDEDAARMLPGMRRAGEAGASGR